MTNDPIEMTEDEFSTRYPLLMNHLNPKASWAIGNHTGCLFETFGEEFEFIRRQDPATVWTLVDGEDGDLYIRNGFQFVNRVGYLVSSVAIPQGVNIEVHIPTQTEPDDEPGEPGATCFPLGQMVVTANASLVLSTEEVLTALRRHASGDWGDLCPEDTLANNAALRHGGRLLSAYGQGENRFWVITEADKQVTTVLLPRIIEGLARNGRFATGHR
jgi:hypothetical protein